MSIDDIKKNIYFLNNYSEKNQLTLRINQLKDSRDFKEILESIIKELNNQNVKLEKDPDIPFLIHISKDNKSQITETKFYKDGVIIFQDKASVAIVQALSPQSNEIICDMCAAPGMKTSLIAQQTNDQATIISSEFLTKRSTNAKKLIKHLNVSNNHLINSDSIIFPIKPKFKFDRVLLDAPCTGSGNFLNHPELKWRQNSQFLKQNKILQKKLLKTAIYILRPGGILVYSTCSLYPEEGEEQIIPYLDQLEPMALPKWFSPSYEINDRIVPGTGRLFPAVHYTQGFFVGKFKKMK